MREAGEGGEGVQYYLIDKPAPSRIRAVPFLSSFKLHYKTYT